MNVQPATSDELPDPRRSLDADREKMIAEAAYYRAEWRGFCAGDPQADWLESETEVDRLIAQRAAEKASLLQRLEKRLHDWDQKLAALTAATQGARVKISAELRDQIAALAIKREEAKQKIMALHDLGSQTCQDVHDHTLSFFDDLHNAIESVIARLLPAEKPTKKNHNGGPT